MSYRKIITGCMVLVVGAAGFAYALGYFHTGSVTYSDDVAPVIKRNCGSCHQPGGMGPFDLLSYKEVAGRSKMILKVLASGYMPPWQADTAYVRHDNSRAISAEEIEIIRQWVEQGKKRGNLFAQQTALATVQFLPGSKQKTVRNDEPFVIPGDNEEHFVKFLIPFELEQELPVRGIRFTAGAVKRVHHANYGVYRVASHQRLPQQPRPIFSNTFQQDIIPYTHLLTDQVHYSGWIPGSSPVDFGAESGFFLPEKGVILLTIHYAASPLEESDQSEITFYFNETEPENIIRTLSLGSGGAGTIEPELILPPNQISSFSLRQEIPLDIEILYVWPHMHLLGKEFKAYALNPASDTIPLIRIPEWNFNWQESYRFKDPVRLQAGSEIIMEASYDNTSSNPFNPYNPPREIESTGLMETNKEMMTMVLIYTQSK